MDIVTLKYFSHIFQNYITTEEIIPSQFVFFRLSHVIILAYNM